MPAKSDPRLLLSWHAQPRFLPPPRLAVRQTTYCPKASDASDSAILPQSIDGWTPQGEYHLAEFCHRSGFRGSPDALIVDIDCTRSNRPLGLSQFTCPKLAIISDTHHDRAGLSGIIGYLKSQQIERAAILYNRNHAHWFRAAGIASLGWFPGLLAANQQCTEPPQQWRLISFVGRVGRLFPRRVRMLQEIEAAGLPLLSVSAERPIVPTILGASAVAFNCSLNGDMNLRVFETLHAGGFLLTDSLSTWSGLSAVGEPGVDYQTYDDLSECLEKARRYLANPEQARLIAASGRKRIAGDFSPTVMQQNLMAWTLGGALAERYAIIDDARTRVSIKHADRLFERLAAYECVQELHRRDEQIRILLLPGCPLVVASDLADLPRAQIAILDQSAVELERLGLPEVRRRITQLSRSEAEARQWDVVIHGAADRTRPASRYSIDLDAAATEAGRFFAEIEALDRHKAQTNGLLPFVQNAGGNRRVLRINLDHGARYLCYNEDASAKHVFEEIFKEDCYKPVAVQQPIRTIVDVGANVGFAATYFRCCFPQSRIFCFEPDPRAFGTLRLTAEMLGNCTAVPYGLGNEDTKTRFYQGADSTALSSVYRNKFSTADAIDIDIRHAGHAMEALGIDSIDLLKVDTEGNELPILRSLDRYLAGVALLFLEFHSEAARRAIERLVESSHVLWRGEVMSAHRGSLFYIRRDLTPSDPLRPPIGAQ